MVGVRCLGLDDEDTEHLAAVSIFPYVGMLFDILLHLCRRLPAQRMWLIAEGVGETLRWRNVRFQRMCPVVHRHYLDFAC